MNTQQTNEEVEIKKNTCYNLKLTQFELLHLRDLMSIKLPPVGESTVSEALATAENRSFIESGLWNKVATLCTEAELPLDEEAPDYIVSLTSVPAMGVFQIEQQFRKNARPENSPDGGVFSSFFSVANNPEDDESEDEDD
jgi:hypothetical protein